MKKNRMKLIISFVLSVLFVMPAYASNNTDITRKADRFLGHADKVVRATGYATIAGAGVLGFFASTYFMMMKPTMHACSANGLFRKKETKDQEFDDSVYMGQLFGGAVFDLASLAAVGYGIRGLRKIVNEKPQLEHVVQKQDKTVEQESEERIDQIVNGAKKAAHFGSRIAAYSFLTVFGLASLMGGAGMTINWALNKENKSWKDKWQNASGRDATITGVAGTLGVSLTTIGIAGLIHTCKRKKEAKKAKTQTHEIAIQTDDVAVCQ